MDTPGLPWPQRGDLELQSCLWGLTVGDVAQWPGGCGRPCIRAGDLWQQRSGLSPKSKAVLVRPRLGAPHCRNAAGERHLSVSRLRRSASGASAAMQRSWPGLVRFAASDQGQPGKLSTPRYLGATLS
ncbi:hypothetical protein NDU88_003446 [Pleurodeles waltl]|uniref:Uncharacterized protein n=1 Tax=Pleurodeles waltl TaxID=8319 RepID=A0AAV7WP55_PLEWA|nr:hypothetical protein NDU88_003446 [Pleurodeles waltl]